MKHILIWKKPSSLFFSSEESPNRLVQLSKFFTIWLSAFYIVYFIPILVYVWPKQAQIYSLFHQDPEIE